MPRDPLLGSGRIVVQASCSRKLRWSILCPATALLPGLRKGLIETFDPGHTFSISELERVCPTVSRATIRRVLGELREKNQVECLGTGRWAR